MLSPWLGAADAIRSTEAARVHHATERRNGVAARGARAAARADAADRRADERAIGQFGRNGAARRIPAGLQELGWTVGRNVQIDYRWGSPDADRIRKDAAELLVLAPDVILSSATPTVGALQQATRTVPIVFALVADPVGAGFVESLARPGGNITGFSALEYGTSGKWLELLKEIAPHVTRAVVLRDPELGLGIGQLAAIQAVAPSLGVELTPIGVREAGEIE